MKLLRRRAIPTESFAWRAGHPGAPESKLLEGMQVVHSTIHLKHETGQITYPQVNVPASNLLPCSAVEFSRRYNLGDVVFALSAAYAFHCNRPEILREVPLWFDTDPSLAEFVSWFPFINGVNSGKQSADVAVYNLHEVDGHPRRNRRDRVLLMGDVAGIKVTEFCPPPNLPAQVADTPARFKLPVQYTILACHASAKLRSLPSERARLLVSGLREAGHCVVMVDSVRAEDCGADVDLTGMTSLSDLCGLIASAHRVVSVDSASLYLSCLFRVPCVGMFTHIAPETRMATALGYIAIRADGDCIPCGILHGRTACEGTASYLKCSQLFPVEAVVEAADKVNDASCEVRSKQIAHPSWLYQTASTLQQVIPVGDYPLNIQHPVVITAAFNHWKYTQRCLRSLQEARTPWPIVLVDDGSTDATREFKGSQQVQVIHHQENKGVSAAWNSGVQKARALGADAVIIINNDTEVPVGSLPVFFEKMTYRRRIIGQALACIGSDWDFSHATELPDEAHYVEGFAWAIHMSVFDTIGLFDAGMKQAYCEDSDFCIRARTAGFRFGRVSEGILHSERGITTRTVKGISEAHAYNTERLLKKHAGKLVQNTIVIRRWAAAGDIVMASKAIEALRQQYPYARLLLQCHACGRDALLYDLDLDGFLDDKDDLSPDLYYDLDNAYEAGQELGLYEHPVSAYCRVVGLPTLGGRYRVACGPEDIAFARSVLSGGPHRPQTIALGLRSAFRPLTMWRGEEWLQLVRQLEPTTRFVLLDMARNPDVGCAALYEQPNILNVTGRTPTLRSCAALLAQCDALVTVDTAYLHLAASQGTPLVALMAGKTWESRMPDGVQAIGLGGEGVDCYPCNEQGHCICKPHCLDKVTSADVVTALGAIAHGHVCPVV